jgi:hypothetical protein
MDAEGDEDKKKRRTIEDEDKDCDVGNGKIGVCLSAEGSGETDSLNDRSGKVTPVNARPVVSPLPSSPRT